jgi:Zn ribbon nucleic-acid-binding protein
MIKIRETGQKENMKIREEENIKCTNCFSDNTEDYIEENNTIDVYCLDCGYEFSLSDET